MSSKRSKIVALIFSVLFLLIINYVVDHSIEFLPQVLQLITYAALPVAGGLITLSFCSLLGTFTDVANAAASYLLGWTSEDLMRNFLVGFLVTAYSSFVRPPLSARVSFLPYMEWVSIALAVYVMYSVARISAKEFVVHSEDQGWKRHSQEVRRETGRDLTRMTSVMEQFIDHGVKEPLLVYLTLHLQRLGETEESILRTLSPLIDYQEDTQKHKLRFFAFPWTKRKLSDRYKKDRENLFNTLLKEIDRLRFE